MNEAQLSPDDIAALVALADGIIPPDGRDKGASSVNAGPLLAGRIQGGINTSLYTDGLRVARDIAQGAFARNVHELNPVELHELLGRIRERSPGFFKQLRLDVSALYLSDPDVWQRLGFPGPSIETGGHPDFDQPQSYGMRREA